MKKKELSLIINILIIIFELISFYIIFTNHGRIKFEYYTEDSNILVLLSSFIYIIYTLLNKKIPKWLSLFKYIATTCLVVTLAVVLFVLVPMNNFNFYGMLIKDAFIFQHLICPILAIISFVFLDELSVLTKKDALLIIGVTTVYSVVLAILNLLGIVSGPYEFLEIAEQSVFETISWYIIMIGISYGIAVLLRKVFLKYNLNVKE